MIQRHAAQSLQRLSRGFPLVCLTGPRQSGKTTLAKACFPIKPYLSLEDPDIRQLAMHDPRGLLENYKDGLILDEAQAAPEIFPYLKTAIDENPKPGRYIVTGSQQFSLLAKITESLAGRAGFVTLLPLSCAELGQSDKLAADVFQAIIHGFYPALFDRDVSPRDWYGNYLISYVERDIRSVLNVRDLGQFQIFIKMCAARVGQILNLSTLALDCGLSHNTARAWLSVLEASGLVYLLRPYYQNFGKRLVKSPKLYFTDTGLACRLLGIASAQELFLHPSRGALFECFVVSELLKSRLNQGLDPCLYYWRDSSGVEIDLVFQEGAITRAAEIKSGKTLDRDFFKGLELWQKFSGSAASDTFLIYAGDHQLSSQGIGVLPWKSAEFFLPEPGF